MSGQRDLKTSESHPIRVDYVPADVLGLRGRIAMTFAPGKIQPDGQDGNWRRDLDLDLRRLRDVYRTALVVSLMEKHELSTFGIPGLLEKVEELGLASAHVSVVDGAVPAMAELIAIVHRILTTAESGKNVVIHCRGGLGRTGLVAACCVVARGWTPEEAVRIVRAARRDAVENDVQREFVSKFEVAWRAEGRAPSPSAAEPTVSRFLGCLLGGALGDALGYPIEFVKPGAAIVSRYGATPPVDLRFAPEARGLISDDTQMTLFTADGIIRARHGGIDEGAGSLTPLVLAAYQRWYGTQAMRHGEAPKPPRGQGWLLGEEGLHARRAPGNTCMSALATSFMGKPVPTVSAPPNDSKGCGVVMRSAPFGLAARSRDEAFREARDAGVLTHGHPSGYLSGAYLGSLVFDVARGTSLDAAMRLADDLLRSERGNEEMRAIVDEVRSLASAGPPSVDVIEKLGGGWTGEEALAISLLCALTAGDGSPASFAAALWRSVAHGGDSDSTGSITGNLLGALHGIEALPQRWLVELELRDVIERVARDLFASSILSAHLDFESYPPSPEEAGMAPK